MESRVDAAARLLVLEARSFEAGKRCVRAENSAECRDVWLTWVVTEAGLLAQCGANGRVSSWHAYDAGWRVAADSGC